MLCLSIDNDHSSVFSSNNDIIMTESVNIDSDETSSTSEPSNTDTKKSGEKNKEMEENNEDIIELITTNKYIENKLTFGYQMIDKDESITRISFKTSMDLN